MRRGPREFLVADRRVVTDHLAQGRDRSVVHVGRRARHAPERGHAERPEEFGVERGVQRGAKVRLRRRVVVRAGQCVPARAQGLHPVVAPPVVAAVGASRRDA
ncbi:MAG: hypothetical protein ACK559_01385, partial [bacterium]